MLYILGSFTCGVDSSSNKVSGWTRLTIHVEHLSGSSTVSNKSLTSFPMNCTVTRGKSFMSRSCPCWLEINVLLPIKILTPLRVLLVVIMTRPCYRWCCLVKILGHVATRMSAHRHAVCAGLTAGCLSKERGMEGRLWKLTFTFWLNEKYQVDSTVKYFKNKFFLWEFFHGSYFLTLPGAIDAGKFISCPKEKYSFYFSIRLNFAHRVFLHPIQTDCKKPLF